MTSCHVNHTTSRGCSRAMAMMKWVLRCPEPSLAWRDLRKDWICVDGWGAGGLHMSHICMERDMNAILRTHIQRNNTTANLTHKTWQTSACISDTHAHPVHFLRDKCILMFSYISTNQGPCDPPSVPEKVLCDVVMRVRWSNALSPESRQWPGWSTPHRRSTLLVQSKCSHQE